MNIQVNNEELAFHNVIHLQHKVLIELYKTGGKSTIEIYWHRINNEIVVDMENRLLQVYFPQETSLLTVLEGLGLDSSYISTNTWPHPNTIEEILSTPVEFQTSSILKMYESAEVMQEMCRDLLPNTGKQVG
jgi:hypothetical protein